MKKLIYFFLAFGLLFGCQEDPIEIKEFGQVEGELLEEDGLTPIPNAIVSTNPATDVIFTDEFGAFYLDSLVAGAYTIRARKEGYEDGLVSVTVVGNQTTSIKMLTNVELSSNVSPDLPYAPSPGTGTAGLDPGLTISWKGSDPDGDTLSYDVYLYTADSISGIPLVSGIQDTFLQLNDLQFGNAYFWQVVVNDGKKSTCIR